MARARQEALFLDREGLLWSAMEKARSVLNATEFALLEEAVRANAPAAKQELIQLCAAWRAEFKAACGGDAARLTANEANVLRDLAKREGGAMRLMPLFKAFWRWRSELELAGTALPQPTPFGLQRHIASVKEFAAKHSPAKKNEALERIREDQRRAQEFALTQEQVREFIAMAKGGVR